MEATGDLMNRRSLTPAQVKRWELAENLLINQCNCNSSRSRGN
jgi:hypothetical protein